MAGLAPILDTTQRWTTAQSRAQFVALAKLRWCIFRNAFRRKGGTGELVARFILFPLSFPRYLPARLFFGLLSATNVVGTLALIAADIGIIIAQPSLAFWSTLLLAAFALANIFFVRMILVWVERWLSTRRAREIFTAFILFASLGFQYLNLHFNPGMQGRHHRHQTSNH